MRITLNGQETDVGAATLAALLDEFDYGQGPVATALNQTFVRAADRAATPLKDGDAVEILTPRQGG
jgi:sulfur carrier protein